MDVLRIKKRLKKEFFQVKEFFFPKHTHYVFGDSHARVFEYINLQPKFTIKFDVLSVGGATAQGLTNPRSKTNALQLFREKINLNCKKKDRLLFFLGEVDCGFVIWYRAQKYKESVELQFERSLNNYEEFLQGLKKDGYRKIFIIETILPTIFDGFEGHIAHERKEVKAHLKERTELTKRYNSRLEAMAKFNGFGFIKITADIMDEESGLVKKSLLNEDKSNHHLNNKRFAPLIYKRVLNVLE